MALTYLENHPDFNGTITGRPDWKKRSVDGVTYNYLHIKPSQEDKATFLLFHGFPNGPSNYDSFIPELTSQGYGIMLPEMLGYGESDKPENIAAYAFRPLCAQIAGLLDLEEIEKVIGLGHDFGGPLMARFSQFYPDRMIALVLGGAPYSPPSPTALNVDAALSKAVPILGYENIGYFKYFPTDRAPKELDSHLESFLGVMFGSPTEWKERLCKSGGLEETLKENHICPFDSWFDDKQQEQLFDYLRRNGMLGPCMWFRAAVSSVNTGDYGDVDSRIHTPFLYFSPIQDPTYPLKIAISQNAFCDDITTERVNTGHWMFKQDPKGTARVILEWGRRKELF